MAENSFDVELANRLAHLESYNKHLYRPNSYLHKWWARRCGSTFRLILKSLAERADQRDYYASGGLEGKIVLDPMLGGGTTLHEAIRMGANVIGYDVDPIPVLQAKATLSEMPLEKLESAFDILILGLEQALAPLFVTTCARCVTGQPVRYLLYGLEQRCACGEVIVVDSLVLRKERSGRVIRLCEKCHNVVSDQEPCGCPDDVASVRLSEKAVKHCPSCAGVFQSDNARPFYQRYHPLVTVANCDQHGLLFQPVVEADLALLAEANALRSSLEFAGPTSVEPGAKSDDLIRREIHDYQDLFSSRQLLYLKTAIDLLQGFEPQVQAYLALLVSTSLEFNVMLCGYKGAGARRAGAVRHAFSHHAYSFPYTAVENNPVFDGAASGTLRKLFHDRIRRGRRWSRLPKERSFDAAGPRFVAIDGEVDSGVEVSDPASLLFGQQRFMIKQGSAANTELPAGTVDYVVTDPPYYDSVQYGNLSAFFRIWLRQMMADEGAGRIRWDYHLSESAVMAGPEKQTERADDHYLQTMSSIFSECQRVLKPAHGRLIFSFHHWKAAGWSAISIALKRAGFELLECHVVHSENPVSVHIANLNALTDDAILVLANEGSDEARKWDRPRFIRTSDSAFFCQDCAEALGWILASSMNEAEISGWWQRQLGVHAGRANNKPPKTRKSSESPGA